MATKEKARDLRNLAVEELRDRVDKLKKELMQYRFQAKTGKLERMPLLKETRRRIARILTVMRENEKETRK